MKDAFAEVSTQFAMDWQFHDPSVAVKTILMVSKYDHCLDDLLYRRRKGEFNMEVTAVVSNHQDLRPMVEREGIRFIHLPVSKDSKAQQEQRLLEIIDETGTELVVLARYMQILSNQLSEQLSGRCINIHHSFLPGFKGAKPYHQAYDRGVKVIGATAHYVTSDLDEGPIIEQILTRVDHNYGPNHLVRVGRDNECMALAKAVKYHIERRVFLDGNKTVVFLGS
jgi:formyltetrahydrofolate deformylase